MVLIRYLENQSRFKIGIHQTIREEYINMRMYPMKLEITQKNIPNLQL